MLYLQATEAEQNVDNLMNDEAMIKEQEELYLKIRKLSSSEEGKEPQKKEKAQLEETKEEVAKPEVVKSQPKQVDSITEIKKKVVKDVNTFESSPIVPTLTQSVISAEPLKR